MRRSKDSSRRVEVSCQRSLWSSKKKKSGGDLPSEFRERIGVASTRFRSTYTLTKEFRERMDAPLSKECKYRAVKRYFRANHPSISLDTIDWRAHVTEEDRTCEVIASIIQEYNLGGEKEIGEMDAEDVEDELAKYRRLFEKFCGDHGIDQRLEV